LLLTLALAGAASAGTPAIGFDLAHAQGANYYFLHFYGNQVLGNTFAVVGTQNLLVTHLGAFDMNPDNEPYWDPANPPLAEHGFQNDHGVALFSYPELETIAEVILPAGTDAPIRDEGYRYLPLDEPVWLEAGSWYVLAAWWATASIEDGGMDTFYLMGTAPDEIPSTVYIHEDIEIIDACFNPNGGDGSTVPAPFIFDMFWGLYAGGANFLIDEPVATESRTWSDVKELFR
jgi:hypothetical protein